MHHLHFVLQAFLLKLRVPSLVIVREKGGRALLGALTVVSEARLLIVDCRIYLLL